MNIEIQKYSMTKIYLVLMRLAFCGISFLFIFSHMTVAQEKKNAPPINWVGGGLLTSDAFAILDEKARHGDSSSALRLSAYYQFIDVDIYKEVEYLEMAALAGDVYAQYIYAEHLADNVSYRDIYDIKKAIYWAQRAVDNGSKEAELLLRMLTEKEEISLQNR